MGIIRDLWRLPEYVKDANNDLDYLDWLHSQIKLHEKPPSSIVRQSGLMLIGNLFAYLVEYAVPKEILSDEITMTLKFMFVPLASAFGVWFAGNVGRHQGSFDKPLIAAYLAASPALLISNVQFGSFSTLAAVFVFNKYSKKWRMKPKRPASISRRLFTILFGLLIYSSLWLSGLYYNCTIEDPDTQKPIKCRVAFDNFMKSSAYTNLAEAIVMLIEHARHQGISGLWREIMQEFDVSGRSSALAILDLDDTATREAILAQYKKLSREYHPDREKDESKKLEKHEKFIQVQEAYRLLKPRVEL